MDPKMMQDNEATEKTPDSETGPGEPPQGQEPADASQEGAEPTKDSESPDSKGQLNLDEEPANVSPDEQKMYDTVVVKAMQLLYDPKRMPVLVDKLKANTDNISGEIGHSAAMTMLTIYRTVQNNDQEIPEDVLYAAGQEIVSQITDIAEAAGLVDPKGSEKVAEAALYEGLRIWGQSMGQHGEITGDKQTEAASLLSQAGIEQDTSNLPGHGPAQPDQSQQDPNAAQPPQGAAPPPGPGIVNQAMGAPQ
jgi:hypothetical protein